MLVKLSEKIRDCHERAAEARRKAEAIDDPALRADFLDMEERWLTLARSYGFTETLGDFTAAMPATPWNFNVIQTLSARNPLVCWKPYSLNHGGPRTPAEFPSVRM